MSWWHWFVPAWFASVQWWQFVPGVLLLSWGVSIFSFTSSISNFMSDVNSMIWLLKASITVRLICVSSISSSMNTIDLMPLSAGFGIPAIAETWWRHMASEECVGGSPGGHSSKCFSGIFYPRLRRLYFEVPLIWLIRCFFSHHYELSAC